MTHESAALGRCARGANSVRRMNRRAPLLLLLFLALGTWGARGLIEGPGHSDEIAPGATLRAVVTRVVDGDTIDVVLDGRRQTVRYIGIDTPESVKPNTPVQCFAKAASHHNDRLVGGRAVTLVVGAEPRDRYGRLLAYVRRRSDGLAVNEELVAGGYARTLTIAPNDARADRFAALAQTARARGAGLWGACSG